GEDTKKENPAPAPSASSVYFNTTVSQDISYKNKTFTKIAGEYLLSKGTNVTTNTSASNEKLFQRAIFAPKLSYAIPVANGTYTVETYHIETYYGKSGRAQQAGQRVFDISIEGKKVKDK